MYGGFAAISNVNLTVRKGEFMGLLGPNGAGKSTTLKAITGLLMPTSGSVRIAGIDIHDHRRAMEHVGCVIETPEPYPGFTPAEIMEYVGRLYGLDSREIEIRARDVLETMRMWEWRDKKIGEFSKGMRQRVVLAQALLPNPDTIILDEPTSGLDPRGMIEIRQTLASPSSSTGPGRTRRSLSRYARSDRSRPRSSATSPAARASPAPRGWGTTH